MYFQQALVTAMEAQKVTIRELAVRTHSDPRWILSITNNCEWHPKLDTILRLCYALRVNVFSFIALAENRSQGKILISQQQNYDLSKHLEKILFFLPEHISLTLRSFRLENGLSQRQLERLTPYNVYAICTRESKRYQNYPTVTTLYSYCEAYNISLEEFIVRAFSFIEN